jgi:hypothetical protein
MPGPIQGFLDGFQTQLTGNVLNTDVTLSFPTAGMIPGQLYHIRIDDSNPPTTFEYCVVQFQDAATVSVFGGGAGRGIGGTAAANHTSGPNSGFVTAVLLRESLLPTFARADTMNLLAFASASVISGQVFNVYGLSGAVQPTRYVGATTGGPPSTGSFLTGDFVLDTANSTIYICTAGGSPGTWQDILTGLNTGITGAVSALTRWVGATGGGAPLSGTWKQGDVITDRTGLIWMCISPGSPGTWQPVTGMARIQKIVAGGGGLTNFDFQNIPTIFSHLYLLMNVRSNINATTDNLYINFNGDTGTNYSQQQVAGVGAAASASEAFATAQPQMLGTVGSTAVANRFGGGRIDILDYLGAQKKVAIADMFVPAGTTTGTLQKIQRGVVWDSLAAINRITLSTVSGATILPNSVATLYGEL